MSKEEQKKKKTPKKFEVMRKDIYKFYVLAKDEEDLKKKLKANPDFSECGEFVSCDFIKFRELKK